MNLSEHPARQGATDRLVSAGTAPARGLRYQNADRRDRVARASGKTGSEVDQADRPGAPAQQQVRREQERTSHGASAISEDDELLFHASPAADIPRARYHSGYPRRPPSSGPHRPKAAGPFPPAAHLAGTAPDPRVWLILLGRDSHRRRSSVRCRVSHAQDTSLA